MFGQSVCVGWGSELIATARDPLFTNATREPTGTVTAEGLTPFAVMMIVAAGGVVVPPPPPPPLGDEGVLLPPPLQPPAVMVIAAATAAYRMVPVPAPVSPQSW
jgi:hypothetical protein